MLVGGTEKSEGVVVELVGNPEESKGAAVPPLQAGYLTLPFTGDQFRTFIRNLLGSPQAINGIVEGAFEVTVEDFVSLHHLLIQRVEQQNYGVLVQFSASLGFSDDSTVELNSIEELATYKEIRPIITQAVHLTWVFLVKFQDKDVPERQTIQVSFPTLTEFARMVSDLGPRRLLTVSGRYSGISFRVEHTARTWGADIEALLQSHLRTFTKNEAPIQLFVRTRRSPISFAIAGLVFLSCVTGAFLATTRLSTAMITDVQLLQEKFPGESSTALAQRLDYLVDLVAGGPWAQFYVAVAVFLVISLLISVAFGVWSEDAADSWAPSFILLNKQDTRHKLKVTRQREQKWRSFLLSLLLSVATGVAGNLVFKWLF